MEKYIQVERVHKLSKTAIQKFPSNSVWVDVWHNGFPSETQEHFTIGIRQSLANYKNYWSNNRVKRVGYVECFSISELIKKCQEIISVLGLKVEDFSLHGSSLGDSIWLQRKLAPFNVNEETKKETP